MAKKITAEKKIVCLGGGIGTSNLIRGLKKYFKNITVVVSMADSGGSAGRLRRLYKVHPVGDLVSCMASLSDDKILSNLLTYRFPGERFAKSDSVLSGHKLGNLIVVGAIKSTGDFKKAMHFIQHVFNIQGKFFPATTDKLSIYVKTKDGKRIFGEDEIARGKYEGKKVIDGVFLRPKNARASKEAVKSIKEADLLVVGPGDLYTNLLPVLIVPEIAKAIKKSKAKKIYIANVANKPYETKNYEIGNYIDSIKKHIGEFPFNTVVMNNNISLTMPKKYRYKFLVPENLPNISGVKVVFGNVVDKNFPLYHDPGKLAKVVWQLV